MKINKKFELKFRFQNLLIWILLYIVASPFLDFFPHTDIFVQILYTIVLISAVYAIHQQITLLWPALLLLLLTTVLIWCHIFDLLSIDDMMVNLVMLIYISALQVIFCTKKQEKSSAENVLIRALICGP